MKNISLFKNKKIKKLGTRNQIFRRLLKNKSAMIGLSIFTVEVIIAILAPMIIPYDYASGIVKDRFMGPCIQHLFGTDNMGRDLLSRVIYGSRYSLTIGVLSTLLGMLLGMFMGAVSGYFGGIADSVIMRILDILQSIPGMLLNIVLAAVMGTGVPVTIIALAIGTTAGCARMFRATILNVRTAEYIEASQSINCSKLRIILHHIVPNAISPMIVLATMGTANAIVNAAALSFIGLGVQAPTPEWGALLSAGRESMRLYPYLVIFPGLAIMITVISLNMLGDGLRDAMDPKLKK